MYNTGNLKSFNNNGYVAYYIPEHHCASSVGMVYEHMIVAEKMLGRELKNGEVVHHKDRNKKNNSPDNLMVFKTNTDHSAYHAGCDIKPDGDVWVATLSNKVICPVCGNTKDYKAKLCIDCNRKEISKHIPTKENLIEYICTYSMVKVGKIFNVSDNAVRKWCKKYGLPYKKKDIDELRFKFQI